MAASLEFVLTTDYTKYVQTLLNILHSYRNEQTTLSRRWRHGSVVRTSVSGWRTFLDVCLIYG